MADPRCRIGKVTLKAGGQLHVLKGGGRCPIASLLVSYAQQHAAHFSDLTGFVIVAWDSSGGYQLSSEAPSAGVIPRTLLPSWLADVVRRELIVCHEITRHGASREA